MDSTFISEEILFLLEGEECISFSNTSLHPSQLPTEEQLRKNIIGIQLSYANCGEQDGGIAPLAEAFGFGSKGIIRKIPKDFRVTEQEDVFVLKHGSISISSRMFEIAKKFGVAGYWDEANLIICASKEYEPILRAVLAFIQPEKAKFAFRSLPFGGRNLMIKSV